MQINMGTQKKKKETEYARGEKIISTKINNQILKFNDTKTKGNLSSSSSISASESADVIVTSGLS